MEPPAQRLAASCLILAGGQGKRLTPDKPLLEIEGRPIIQRVVDVVRPLFQEVLIVTNTPEKYLFLGLPMVADQRRGCGPLMGILSGLSVASHDAAFVCAADMPFLEATVIRAQFQEMGSYDVVVPCPSQRPEWLHAFYSRRCLPAMGELLEAGLFTIRLLAQSSSILYLDRDWFLARGLSGDVERAFVNINTAHDYRSWLGEDGPLARPEADGLAADAISPRVLDRIRQTLVEQETAYQGKAAGEPLSSLWNHSWRAGRIARAIAQAEGWEPMPALLAGLLHDTGKFAQGDYHQDDIPEEHHAAAFAQSVLAGSEHERWIPEVSRAILTMYLEEAATSRIGRAVYDADCLDKLGCMGVAQFFAKSALRRRFLDADLLARASVELTYAHHAPDTLKTAAGRALARQRQDRTRRFFGDLLEEWAQLGLGALDIVQEEISGIVCLLVIPRACSCGGGLEVETDIRDAIKCRSVMVRYACLGCSARSEYSFCLPNVKGLPPLPPLG